MNLLFQLAASPVLWKHCFVSDSIPFNSHWLSNCCLPCGLTWRQHWRWSREIWVHTQVLPRLISGRSLDLFLGVCVSISVWNRWQWELNAITWVLLVAQLLLSFLSSCGLRSWETWNQFKSGFWPLKCRLSQCSLTSGRILHMYLEMTWGTRARTVTPDLCSTSRNLHVQQGLQVI